MSTKENCLQDCSLEQVKISGKIVVYYPKEKRLTRSETKLRELGVNYLNSQTSSEVTFYPTFIHSLTSFLSLSLCLFLFLALYLCLLVSLPPPLSHSESLSLSLCLSLCTHTHIFYHKVILLARFSLTLSRHSFPSSIAPGSSLLHHVSVQSYIYIYDVIEKDGINK